ncbi:protoporphyrinogen/coproporphyrinogen oxidase [Pseudolysinimonas sp.]|uniref:protoporphyrinogen/coproporphyrinogen oxidase n=1 Tax=Pseudolysinimonas sp. TaxID=2680009 RepID=UPI003F7CF523
MPERVDEVVVGGGVAGLVLARRLAMAGRRVVLLEASDRLGGQVRRVRVAGIDVDGGAESFATRGGVVAQLATEIGLGGEIVAPVASPAWLYRADGTAQALPATSLLGIPGVPLAADVIAAVGTRAAMRAQLDVVMPATVGADATTLGELVRRRMGDAVLEELVDPIVRGVHSTRADDLPLDRANPGLRAALLREGSLAHAVLSLRESATAGSQVGGIRGGMARLVDEVTADLELFGVDVRRGAAIDLGAVTPERAGGVEGRVTLATAAPTGDDRLVSVVVLAVDDPALDDAPRGTGLLVAAEAPGVRARALTHLTAKWEWMREQAAGVHLLRLSYDRHDLTDPAETARADASALLGIDLPSPLDVAVVPWRRAVARTHAVDGMHRIGEAESGTGLAAVIGAAEREAGRLLGALSGGTDSATD